MFASSKPQVWLRRGPVKLSAIQYTLVYWHGLPYAALGAATGSLGLTRGVKRSGEYLTLLRPELAIVLCGLAFADNTTLWAASSTCRQTQTLLVVD